jgi:hypothetical protein
MRQPVVGLTSTLPCETGRRACALNTRPNAPDGNCHIREPEDSPASDGCRAVPEGGLRHLRSGALAATAPPGSPRRTTISVGARPWVLPATTHVRIDLLRYRLLYLRRS